MTTIAWIMNIPRAPHRWKVSPKRAIAIQSELADRVRLDGEIGQPRLAAGADIAFSKDGAECIAAAVLWDIRRECLVEHHVVRRPLSFPYVPGLLSFREAPAIVAALRTLQHEPDVFLFDGQGYAHPRRFGLASHVGVWLDRPSIGCAKSILVGDGEVPARSKGSFRPLTHRDELVGISLRTRADVKPMYISVGHRISLDAARRIVLQCCTRYRMPEPTRLADKLVAEVKRDSSA